MSFKLLVPALGMLLLVIGCGSRLEPTQLHTTGEHAGEIRGAHTAGQTFVAQHDGLQSVDVLLATFSRHNSHPVTFHLRKDPQSDGDLRTVSVSAAEVADNTYHRFRFAPISDSQNQRYYFFIDSPQSQPGDAITAWIGPPAGYREGSMYVAGQAREGQLVFRLRYSNPHIIVGVLRDLVQDLPAGLAAAALFLLPGLALLLWLAPVWKWDRLQTLAVASAISAALFPLLLLFSRAVGLRWSGAAAWSFLVLCFALLVWRLRHLAKADRIQIRWPAWRGLPERPTPETWLAWAVVALVFGVRWLVVRPLSVPMWGDSHQHTYIVQLMIEHRGLFDSWEPYSPYASFTIHFGFHAAVAFFHWVTGIGVLRAVILVGQIFNGLAVVTLYPLAMRISGSRSESGASGRWAGVVTVLVVGLLMPMPMEYVNWGRYPQLAGQMILPVALWLFWRAADYRGEGSWKAALLAAITAAGMTLAYYRMPYYYAAFLLAWLLFYGLFKWRGDKKQWLRLIRQALLVALIALALILSWGSNLTGGRLATGLAQGVGATPSLESIRAQYLLWQDIDRYVPFYLFVLSLVAVAWSVVKRRWTVTMLVFWTVLLASLVAARLVHLPGASHMQSFAILISLYLPVGLAVGWLVAWLAAAVSRRWAVWGAGGTAVILLVASLVGFRERMTVVDPTYTLVTPADEVAMDWIGANVPLDAVFLVNGFLIYGGRYAAGADAGWWIPFLAGRSNTMPPQYALFNEAETVPGYGDAVVQLVADLQDSPPTTPRGLEKLCQLGVTHVYVGQRQGRASFVSVNPYLVPDDLAASPYFHLLYHQDRVWIFSLKVNACP